jgi:hypothetical protein
LQGKAALSIKVIKPTWERVGSGLKISREGTVLLEFATSLGPQQYDWSKKEVRLHLLLLEHQKRHDTLRQPHALRTVSDAMAKLFNRCCRHLG